MRIRPISKKRQEMIDAKNASGLTIGENISVKYNAVQTYFDKNRENQTVNCVVIELGDKIKVKYSDSSVYKTEYLIELSDIVGRDTYKIGANPFDESTDNIRSLTFDFDSILFNLDILETGNAMQLDFDIDGTPIKELNWNPFVYDKNGKKQYYQRPFVWTLENKQLLIESVYQGIDCGKILVRKRGWEELKKMQKNGETELAFRDIVDGKQRLNAMKEFILGIYPDANGNYFEDLSSYSQYRFTEHQLFSYAEMGENTKDENVIHQFLKLNFTRVPQSKEHIDFVKSLQKKI